MNLVLNARRLAVAILLPLATTACQEKDLLKPSLSPTPAPQNASTSSERLALTTSLYRLVKHGENTLSYDGKGRLVSVTNSNGITSSYYSYPNDSTIVGGYAKEGGLFDKIVYSMRNGKAFTSKLYVFPLQIPGVPGPSILEYDYSYSYNSNGRLEYCRFSLPDSYPQSFDYYSYGSDGNLSQVVSFDLDHFPNKNYDYRPFIENRYRYLPASGGPVADKYPVTPFTVKGAVALKGVDPYLPIFGTFSKHLVQQFTSELYTEATGKQKRVLFDYSFQYTLNDEQYVKERKTLKGGTVVSTAPYQYVSPAAVR